MGIYSGFNPKDNIKSGKLIITPRMRTQLINYWPSKYLTYFFPFYEAATQRNNDSNVTKNPLDGCRHIFLDVGSNRGVQIRKLFQPALFPSAPIVNHFEEMFGADEDRSAGWGDRVCAVAFEPNPRHAEELTRLAEHYRAECGYRVLVYDNTAVVGDGAEHAWFDAATDDGDSLALGGHIIGQQEKGTTAGFTTTTITSILTAAAVTTKATIVTAAATTTT